MAYAILYILTGEYLYFQDGFDQGAIFSTEEVKSRSSSESAFYTATFTSINQAEKIFTKEYWKRINETFDFITIDSRNISFTNKDNRPLFEIVEV